MTTKQDSLLKHHGLDLEGKLRLVHLDSNDSKAFLRMDNIRRFDNGKKIPHYKVKYYGTFSLQTRDLAERIKLELACLGANAYSVQPYISKKPNRLDVSIYNIDK